MTSRKQNQLMKLGALSALLGAISLVAACGPSAGSKVSMKPSRNAGSGASGDAGMTGNAVSRAFMSYTPDSALAARIVGGTVDRKVSADGTSTDLVMNLLIKSDSGEVIPVSGGIMGLGKQTKQTLSLLPGCGTEAFEIDVVCGPKSINCNPLVARLVARPSAGSANLLDMDKSKKATVVQAIKDQKKTAADASASGASASDPAANKAANRATVQKARAEAAQAATAAGYKQAGLIFMNTTLSTASSAQTQAGGSQTADLDTGSEASDVATDASVQGVSVDGTEAVAKSAVHAGTSAISYSRLANLNVKANSNQSARVNATSQFNPDPTVSLDLSFSPAGVKQSFKAAVAQAGSSVRLTSKVAATTAGSGAGSGAGAPSCVAGLDALGTTVGTSSGDAASGSVSGPTPGSPTAQTTGQTGAQSGDSSATLEMDSGAAASASAPAPSTVADPSQAPAASEPSAKASAPEAIPAPPGGDVN